MCECSVAVTAVSLLAARVGSDLTGSSCAQIEKTQDTWTPAVAMASVTADQQQAATSVAASASER